MTLALYGKSRRRQGTLVLCGLLAVVLASVAAMWASGVANAAFTGNLNPIAPGTDQDWRFSDTVGNVDDGFCAPEGEPEPTSDFVYSDLDPERASWHIDESSVPDGSLITAIEVSFCYFYNLSTAPYVRVDGLITDVPYATSQFGIGPFLTTQSINVVDFYKTGSTEIQIGIRNTDAREQLVSAIWARIEYTPPVGTIVLTKYDNIGGADTWNFTASDAQVGGGNPQLELPNNLTGVTVSNFDSWDVLPGQYSISEDEGHGICPSTGAQTGDYETLVLVSDNPIGANELVNHGTATGNFQVNDGETVYVAFANRDCSEVLSAASIIVRKYVDHDGDGVADVLADGWEITITGKTGAASDFGPVTLTTGDSGLGTAALLGVPDGTYDIEENTKVTHTPLGSDWRINGLPNGTHTSGAIQLTDIPVNLNEELNVDFFNQPKGKIIVVKTVDDNVGNVGVAGWQFRLTGCGVSVTEFTDGTGTAVFSNLDACANHIVTEQDANEDGFTVSPSAVQFVNLGPAEEEAVTFHNVRNPGTTPGITTTPTTPTTPPDTATPTNTPTTPDDTTTPDTTTPDPAETEDTAGEITPGPGTAATPIAPDSGSGLAGNSTGASIMLLLMCLAAITMGSGFLALGRKRS